MSNPGDGGITDNLPVSTEDKDHPKEPAKQQTANTVELGAEDAAEPEKHGLLFGVEDTPPWPIVAFYSVQNTLAHISGPISSSFILVGLLCVNNDDVFFAELLSTSLFMMGLTTIIQCSLGVRLPVIQGSSFSYFPPVIAMMSSAEWKCPELPDISGALALAPLVQILLGCTGAIGFLMNYIGPLTIIPTVSLIGLAMFPSINGMAAQHWGIAMTACFIMLLCSLLMKTIHIPSPAWNKVDGWYLSKFPVFQMFPHAITFGLTWLLCYIFTLTDVFPTNPDEGGYYARTDHRSDIIHRAKWFFWPYPGQWGTPTVNLAMFLGLAAVQLTTTVESIGDYYVTASICGLPPPPKHAVNRGITTEGIGSILSGVMGAGHATTTYSGNASIINITKMGNRLTWVVTGCVFMFLGVFGKFGAVMACLPDPVVGGVNIVGIGLLVTVGLSNMRHIDITSSRNMMIIGVSFMLGLTVPFWLQAHPGAIQTGSSEADQVLTVFLSTNMFIGGIVGFILDNIVPGTAEERGIENMLRYMQGSRSLTSSQSALKVYDIPLISNWLRQHKIFSYIPILPSYMYKKEELDYQMDEVSKL